jgi:hypothetical protein
VEYGACEIVRVLGSRVLTDMQLRNLRGAPRTKMYPGYYLLLWPKPGTRKATRAPLRLGPFASSAEARLLATSAGAFGLVGAPLLRPACAGSPPASLRLPRPAEAVAVF